MKNPPPFFLTIILIVSLFSFTTISKIEKVNASATKIIFNPSQILVGEGSNFTVQVQTLNAPPFTMFWITINYNTTVIDALNASTWQERYINIDENHGTIEISALTTPPVEGNQTLATINFKAALNSNSTLQLTDTQIYDPQQNPIPHTTETAQIEIVGSLNISLKNAPMAYLEQYITIYGNLTIEETPVNTLFGVEVRSPDNIPLATKIVGSGNGTYPLKILNFYPSDEYGNPLSCFNAGFQAHFTITVKNLENENLPILIVITVFDMYKTPVGFTMFQGTIFSLSEIMFIGSLLIRNDAFNGTAIAYADVFSNWPKNYGIPYCPEQSTTLQIINGATKTPMFISSNEPTIVAQYNFTLRLPLFTGIGNYTIYATSHYKVQRAYAITTFEAKLICDYDNDGKVGPHDLALLIFRYGSTPNSPKWDPNFDINKDGKVGPYDLAFLISNYGKHV
jgi:hypothetical protein